MSRHREEIDIRILNNYVDTSNDEVIEAFNKLARVIDRINQEGYEIECPIEDLQMFKVSTEGVKTMNYSADSKEDKDQYRSGLVFKNKKFAEDFLKKQQLIFKINEWAKDANGDWKPDWGTDSRKYQIYCNAAQDRIFVTYHSGSHSLSMLPYFKSFEVAKRCIELFGDEILEILCDSN